MDETDSRSIDPARRTNSQFASILWFWALLALAVATTVIALMVR